MKTQTVQEFVNAVDDNNTFTVRFIKRTNGEERTMNARRRVSKGVKNDEGTNGSWNRANQDAQHNVLTCYDMNKIEKVGKKGAHRRINLDDILEVRHHGERYLMDQDKGVLVEVKKDD
ncbi:hypothetical protein PBI_SCTP2_209 [Salicola phage SCTP-2]|nr:hypothetical protein PBI_SCTP2_209 [Salicola phage SCTP-2]